MLLGLHTMQTDTSFHTHVVLQGSSLVSAVDASHRRASLVTARWKGSKSLEDSAPSSFCKTLPSSGLVCLSYKMPAMAAFCAALHAAAPLGIITISSHLQNRNICQVTIKLANAASEVTVLERRAHPSKPLIPLNVLISFSFSQSAS